MKIQLKSKDPVLILSLQGELTISNRDKVLQELDAFLSEDKCIVIDGRNLSYVDSSGLGVFLELNNKLKQKGLKPLAFVNLNPVVRKSLEVTHLVQNMPIYNTEQEAQAGFTQDWSWQIPSQLVYVKSVSNRLLDCLSSLGLEENFLVEMRLCIEEAVINAIKHGSKQNSQKIVTVTCKMENKRICFKGNKQL